MEQPWDRLHFDIEVLIALRLRDQVDQMIRDSVRDQLWLVVREQVRDELLIQRNGFHAESNPTASN